MVPREGPRLAEAEEEGLCAGDGDVEAPEVAEEAEALGADEGDEDDVRLGALRRVDGRDPDGRRGEEALEEPDLARVEGEDVDVCAAGRGTDRPRGVGDERRLARVGDGGPRAPDAAFVRPTVSA